MSDRLPKRRLVSSAGPAVPVRRVANDSVPNSWMARLEAARHVTGLAPDKAPPLPQQPPPLKPSTNNGAKAARNATDSSAGAAEAAPKPDAPVGQPAHLLVAQLEAEEQKRKAEESQRVAALLSGDKSDEIAKVEIAIQPEQVKKKRVPDWLVFALIAAVVIAAVAVIVHRVRKEPVPVAQVDPAVQAEIERKRQAIAALEEGHQLVQGGKAKADEAIKAYSRALQLDPSLAKAERGLAIAYANRGDEETAMEHYKDYLRMTPDADDASDVQKILQDYEKTRQKREAAKRATESGRDTAAAHGRKLSHRHSGR